MKKILLILILMICIQSQIKTREIKWVYSDNSSHEYPALNKSRNYVNTVTVNMGIITQSRFFKKSVLTIQTAIKVNQRFSTRSCNPRIFEKSWSTVSICTVQEPTKIYQCDLKLINKKPGLSNKVITDNDNIDSMAVKQPYFFWPNYPAKQTIIFNISNGLFMIRWDFTAYGNDSPIPTTKHITATGRSYQLQK